MKKVITKLISLVLVLTCLFSVMTACDLVTVNTDRDMKQVIATVRVDETIDSDDILKKELQAGYMSYGYQYVSSYGYSISQAYQAVLDNLVANRIIIQYSRIELASTYNGLLTKTEGLTDFEAYFKANALANGKEIDPKSGDVENLRNYLTAYENEKILYQTRKSVNDLIDSYVKEEKEEEDSVLEDSGVTARTAPQKEGETADRTEADLKTATASDKEIAIAKVTLGDSVKDYTGEGKSVYDLDMAVYKNYKIDISTNKRKKAFGELLSFLKESGFIESTESYDFNSDVDNVLNYSYFKSMEKQYVENAIVSKYEDSLVAGIENKLTSEGLWAEYEKEYKNQEALYRNDYSAYETALEGVSDSSLVLYNPFGGYGYVMNLLIPFSAEQTAKLDAKKAEKGITQKVVENYRNSLSKEILAKDLRDSWVYLSNGTYDNKDKSFTFDGDYRVSDLESINKFIGEVIVRDAEGKTKKDDNGVEQTDWAFYDVISDSIAMDEFFSEYVTPATGINGLYFDENDPSTVGKLDSYSDEVFDKFSDLMYAFSSDTGCLGKYYGYLYSPYTSADTYVKEFSAASKAVVEKGVGAYTTVLTDFGYHIILCTKTVETVYGIDATSKEKFLADVGVEGSFAYKYREIKLDAIVSTEVSKVSNKYINVDKDNKEKVTYNKKAYSDLITEKE